MLVNSNCCLSEQHCGSSVSQASSRWWQRPERYEMLEQRQTLRTFEISVSFAYSPSFNPHPISMMQERPGYVGSDELIIIFKKIELGKLQKTGKTCWKSSEHKVPKPEEIAAKAYHWGYFAFFMWLIVPSSIEDFLPLYLPLFYYKCPGIGVIHLGLHQTRGRHKSQDQGKKGKSLPC